MKVLYFFSLGFDTPNPSYHLMSAMIEDTLKNGIDVHMIATHTTGKNPDIPDNLKGYENLTYDIIKRKNVSKSAFIKRYLDGIGYAFIAGARLKKAKGYDLIYVQSSPTVLYNLVVAKILGKGKPIIYSIQDMFPGSAINSGVIKSNLLGNIFKILQKVAYKLSDKITVISDDMKQKVVEEGVAPSKIEIIINWYDDQSVEEVDWDKNRFVQKYKLDKDKFYVQYAGTMGYVFDYRMVIEVASLLKEYKDIEFQMIGQGSQKDTFIKEKEELGLDNIIFYPLEPQNMVSDVYSTCSVCLIPLKKGIIGNSVPSKAGLLMACKRPVINSVDENSSYYKMFNKNKMGISVSNENPEEVAKAILKLYQNADLAKEYAHNGYQFGTEYYARSNNTIKLIQLFNDLNKKKG